MSDPRKKKKGDGHSRPSYNLPSKSPFEGVANFFRSAGQGAKTLLDKEVDQTRKDVQNAAQVVGNSKAAQPIKKAKSEYDDLSNALGN